MTESAPYRKRGFTRFQFGIRSLLCCILFAAVLLATFSWFLQIRNTMPLSDGVKQFNDTTEYYDIDHQEAPLTCDDVIQFLSNAEEVLSEAPPAIEAIYRQILKSHRLPNNSSFEIVGSGGDTWIALGVRNSETGYMIFIRKIYDPYLK